MQQRMVKVGSIHKRFSGKFLNQDEHNQERLISFPGFARLGFELNGIFLNEEILSAVCFGAQESKFLDTLSEEVQHNTISKIFQKNPPLFILSKRFQHSQLLISINHKVNNNRSAIIQTELTTAEIYALIGNWLTKALSEWTTIHGTVLNIWGEGVLIIGDPGVGKSEAASELIKLNHLFLGDDAIDVTRLGNIVIARANELTKDFMHIRGLGILNIKEMYGGSRVINETQISVVIQLKHLNLNDPSRFDFENVGDRINYHNLLGVNIPIYTLPVTSGRNVCDLIELAVVDMKLKKQGYNAAKELNKRYKKITNN